LGIFYDVFRVIRLLINPRNLSIFIEDIIYFLVSGFITFIFVLILNYGESRFYILAGETLGWILYHISLGDLIYNRLKNTVKNRQPKIKK
ncbi:MAG: spore cortex biosynthesis protein YabQ, partial [Clostridia bacterium]|nr:spore cortex biosynthesis protein YabQ [Clostridia bacterium]